MAGTPPVTGEPADYFGADPAKGGVDPAHLSASVAARPDLYDQVLQLAYPKYWARTHLVTDRGLPFSQIDWSARPWLEQLYDDTHPEKAAEKAAQLGLTTEALIEALHRAAVWGETVIYTMPSGVDAKLLVNDRLNKLIDASPYLRAALGRTGSRGDTSRPTDNMTLKQFRSGGAVHFRGTLGPTTALSIPAQALYHDEVDASQASKLEEYEDRLGGVANPLERRRYRLSTPTVAGFGIDAVWQEGDGRRWLIRCAACRWEGEIDYWTHTRGELTHLQCQCGAKLDPRLGRYVADYPGRWLHSYRLSGGRLLLAVPGAQGEAELAAIHARRERTRFMRNFDNKVLGITSTEGVFQATMEQLRAALFNRPTYLPAIGPQTGSGPYFMGIDQGNTLTIIVHRCDPELDEGHARVVFFGQFRDTSKGSAAWRKAAELMGTFRIVMCGVDGAPQSAPAHDLAAAFPGRVLVCYYGEEMKTEVAVPASVAKRATGQVSGRVSSVERVDITIDRTQSLDNTMTDILGGRYWMPGPPTSPDIGEVLRQIANNARVPEGGEDDGEPVYRWINKGPNDYFHAWNYGRIAEAEWRRQGSLRPNRLAMDLGISGFTPPR